LVTAMNALARNFQSEFPEWQSVFEGRSAFHQVAGLIERAGEKLQAAKNYVNPPLVTYAKEVRAGEVKSGPAFNLFSYLLAGMSAMFLLFMAGNGMADLHRELRQRTFERYHTLHQQLLPFVASKVIFTVVLLLLSSAIMLGGGALFFRIRWQQPIALAGLTFGYACFAASLMAVLVTLVSDERHAGALNNIVGMALGLAGGCAFPPQQLPAFLREHITPLLPSYWFAETVRSLQSGSVSILWVPVVLKLVGLSALLIAMAAFLVRRQFKGRSGP